MVSIPGFHPGDWSSILHGAIVFPNPSDLGGVGVVSEKESIMQNILESNIQISLSQLDICMVLAGLYSVKAKQEDDLSKKMVQKIIDKIANAEVP